MDTCVLSEIGRMNKEDRGQLLYNFSIVDKLQIVLTPFNLIEIDNIPDDTVKQNIYSFLDWSYVGFAKNSDKIFEEEINMYFDGKPIDIIEFSVSFLQKDRNGDKFNFKTIKEALLGNQEFIETKKAYDKKMIEMQNLERPLKDIDAFFNLMIFHRIYNLDKEFLKKLNGEFIDFNKIPAYVTWAYSYANKIGSGAFRKKFTEMNDVSMSYVAPYVDIIVAEKKQVARYNEIIKKGLIKLLDNKKIKKYNEVIKRENNKIVFSL